MHPTRRWARTTGVWVLAAALLLLAPMAWAAYRAHGNNADGDTFLTVYPQAKGSRLDDCFLCHPGGSVDGKAKGSCDYCHATYGLTPPHGPLPLNAFAQDYIKAGRDKAAVLAISNLDSDGDGYTNQEEIRQLAHPGEKGDRPGLKQPTAVFLTKQELKKVPSYTRFLLMNASKSSDFYATYHGIDLWDLLQKVGLSPEAQSISIFSADGYGTDFTLEEIKRFCPPGVFYSGLPWVEYPLRIFYRNQETIPGEPRVMLAYEREGKPLIPGRLSLSGQKMVLDGEGPYRLVVPQFIPSGPDRPSTAPDKNASPFPFDPAWDHNAGRSVRSVVAIRVNPLPPGTTDFNWQEGGWNLVDAELIVVYGAIRPR